MDRRKVLGVVAVVALVSAGVGWVGGQRIKSQAEIAAAVAPPTASLITVPVEQVSLSSNVVTRGQVRFSDSTQISVEPSVQGFTIVTATPLAAGEMLAEGDVLIEIAGRPVIALQGDLPAFRSLTPALVGPDVRQLEEALVRIGLDPGTVDDTYTEATEAAVRGLYERVGYAAEEPGPDETNSLATAADDVRRAEQSLRDARQQAATDDTPASQRRALDLAVEEAQNDVRLTELSAEQAKNEVWMAASVAKDEAAEANATLTRAGERAAIARDGIDPDTGEQITPAKLDEINNGVQAASELVELADQAAKAAAELEILTFIEQDGLVASAKGRLDIAVASRTEGLTAPADNNAAQAINDAKAALADAKELQVKTAAEVGVRVPSAEIVFVPRLPQTIERVGVEVGENTQGPVMRITGSEIVIDSSVPAADRPLLSVGDLAVVDDSATGLSFEAEISELADNPGGGELGDDRFAMKLKAIDGIPEDALDRNLRVTIAFGSTGGDVLAVPLAALSATADGSSRIELERDDGSTEFVEVTPGLRAGGLVEVTPVQGSVEAGDRAVVGRDSSGAADSDDGSGDDGTGDDGEAEQEDA